MTTTLLGQPIDERTEVVDLPLPHIDNWQEDDVPRLRQAFWLIDAAVQLLGLDIDSRDDAMAARAALLEYAAARPSAMVYAYDEQGRVATVNATVSGAQRLTTFAYDAQSRVATVSYGVAGGATRKETFNYDADTGRLTGVTAVETAP